MAKGSTARTAAPRTFASSSPCSPGSAPPGSRTSPAARAEAVAAVAVGPAERATELATFAGHVAGCTKCRLHQGRTQVVFGSGDSNADLMFVGEAPGFHEDQQGLPFVGQAGKLLEQLLGGIGLSRSDVYIANVLKCLRYNALIQLGDGSWERIGRLVRAQYEGFVMSVDDAGHLVPRRVTGWHESPLGDRRVFRLSYRSAKIAGSWPVGIQLTGDHPVLTERGYVPVEELVEADRVATGQGLSRLAHDVVCGTVLGDGHLNARSAHLFYAHSERQAEYAEFKASLLSELNPRLQMLEVAAVVGGEAFGAVHVRTLAHRALRTLRRDFYDGDKRVPTWLEGRLNERMLAIWFMDDGHSRVRPNRQPLAEIATVGFREEDLQILLRALARLGLPAKASRGRLYFDVPTTRALSERIARYVPPSMRYKLHPEVASHIPFDASLLTPGPPEVLYDEVDVDDVTHQWRSDRTFFCLDVEETHNFVTAGGVVHNCRPPGNRDPAPDEIEACESHLFRQVELIQPKVVATLGNFATKLLSGKSLGITRVHGQEQETTIGGRRVLLYPLYHPAAALYTPAMLKLLEDDFRRIPELLGRATAPEPQAEEPVLVPTVQPAVQLGLF
jgi:uracil-DNA glycosylase